MEHLEIHAKFSIYNSKEELPNETRLLLIEAEKAREKAHAPYSHFRVGAAVLLDNGEIITGNNQENAAYPSGLCAERVAVFYANAQFPHNTIKQLVVTARSEKQELKEPISPCGSCRQAIAEYEINQNQPIEIYFMGETGFVYKADSIKALLPLLFDKKNLD